MLKINEIKKLLGFNPTWLIICSIILTGIGFPFIFLYSDFSQYMAEVQYNLPIGIFYASFLVLGNSLIFYKFKTAKNKEQSASAVGFSSKQFLVHLVFTLAGSFLMYLWPKLVFTKAVYDIGDLFRNLIGSCLFASIIIGIFETTYSMNALHISMKKQEQLKRENVESQLETLKNQVKPHFLFNSLNTLTSLIPDEPDLAIDYVQKLSQVYRYILEIKDKRLIPIQEEMNCIHAYLFMLQIRFGENLKFDFDNSGLEYNHHIVPLSIQLLVENAIKHNVISNKKPLTITIKKGEKDHLLVSNNFQAKMQQMPSTGTGLANIKSRYEILSNQKVEVTQTDANFTVALPLVLVK